MSKRMELCEHTVTITFEGQHTHPQVRPNESLLNRAFARRMRKVGSAGTQKRRSPAERPCIRPAAGSPVSGSKERCQSILWVRWTGARPAGATK